MLRWLFNISAAVSLLRPSRQRGRVPGVWGGTATISVMPGGVAAWRSYGICQFEPFSGAWRRRGATKVHLVDAQDSTVRQALIAAWRNTAPMRLAEQFDEEWRVVHQPG